MNYLKSAAAALLLASFGACSGVAEEAPSAPAKGGPPMPPAPITLSSRPGVSGGEALYVEKCVMCHGPNGMGYGLLARRVDEPNLEKRTDLSKDYVILAARRGIGNMPSIPRGEVSDEQLAEIATYLASGKGPAAPAGGSQ